MYSASLFGLLALGVQCVPFRAFSRLFLSFPAFSCLFGLLAFMCTVHVFSPTFCGLSRRRLRGSELVRAWVRRWLRSPLPSGVPCGLERPLFRWRWRRVASLLAVGWCCVLASPFPAVRHWNSDSLALRSEIIFEPTNVYFMETYAFCSLNKLSLSNNPYCLRLCRDPA